jgi:hypothetical protein
LRRMAAARTDRDRRESRPWPRATVFARALSVREECRSRIWANAPGSLRALSADQIVEALQESPRLV